ncbi:beta strand repeat-containing protein [Rhodoluna limnophila]|uniref:beta strand repeat-containing protein n=1 Tax=Rhodoluna limnophila TaxID=232537 RepID=UPI001105ED16|nr:hypothetical protein [Rhodoluna limnophila]
MSKNLTRKGLAFGALVALGSSVIAGAPAHAVDNVALAPNSGTSYLTTLAGAFVLKAEFGGAVPTSQLGDLRFKITQTGAKVISAAIGSDLANSGASYTYLTADLDATNASFVTAKLPARSATPVDGEKIASYTEAGAVKLTASGTATASADVTAWLDIDNDGVIDSTEYSSVTRTVTFHKATDLSAVTTLTAPVAGQASLAASTVITPELNSAMLATNAVTVDFAGGNAADGNATFASGKWSATGATTVAGATTYTAQAKVDGTAIGNVASQSVAAVTVATITAAVTDNGDTQDVTPAAGTTNKASKVRAGVKNAEVVLTLKKVDGTAVGAGIPVVVGVDTTVATTPVTAAITVAGTAVSTTIGGDITVNSVTDANGQVKLAVVNQLGTAADKLTFTASAEGISLDTNTGAAAQAFELAWANPAYTAVSTAVGSAVRSIAEGGSTTFNYDVKDNFGTAIGSGARLEFVVAGTASATSYVNLVGGKASITVTDTTANVASAITVDATLQTQDVATSNWTSTAVAAAQQTVNVTSTVAAFDTVPVASSVALSTAATLTASVNNPGAAVTVAANGVTFTVDGVEYANSVTLFSAATTGDISVSAKSNIAGAKTVTYTVGSESKTAVLTVGAAAETAGTNIDLSAVPATIVPGSTLVFTGYLKDVYGNAVDTDQGAGTTPTFSVAYAGPGFIVGGTTPTATDADGKFTFTVILGANDAGSATVTVKYDADGATTTIAEISKSATVSVAKAVTAATAAASGSTGKIYASATNAAGKKVVVKVSGKFVTSFTGTAAKKSVAIAALKGNRTVTIYVGGTLVLTKLVTIK